MNNTNNNNKYLDNTYVPGTALSIKIYLFISFTKLLYEYYYPIGQSKHGLRGKKGGEGESVVGLGKWEWRGVVR